MKGKGKKKARPSPWTKQFYCLAYCDQEHVPVSEEELDELYHAGLGLKKITIPDINAVSNSHFRSVIMENFPPLQEAGGFDFLRCVPNTKRLEPFSQLAQTNPQVLQERAHKSKVFVRPVQMDLLRPSKKRLHYVRLASAVSLPSLPSLNGFIGLKFCPCHCQS